MRTPYFWLLAVYCAAVLALSIKPNPPVPDLAIPHIDKIGHFGMYGLMAALTYIWLRNGWANIGAVALFFGPFLFASGYGAFCELLQRFTPERTFSWGDMAANALGALTVQCALYVAAPRLWPTRSGALARDGSAQ